MKGDEVEKELQFHIDQRTDDLIASGRTADEARREARLEFGGILQVTEACREERQWHLLVTLRQDVLYALRTFRRTPGFAAVAVLCVALGIGASTAIFSVVDNLLFRPPPFEHVDRLVCLFDTHPTKVPADAEVPPSPGNLLDWRARTRAFDDMVAWRNWYYALSDVAADSGHAESLRGVRVSPAFFSMLGVRAEIGRTFDESEARPGRDQVLVLSHALWSRHFNADPQVVGRRVLVDAKPVTIIGVLPRAFQFYQPDLDLWMPLNLESGARDRQNHSVMVFARIAAGVSRADAQSELDTITKDLAREHPDTNDGWGARMVSLYPSRDVRDVRPALMVLLAASMLVLLIACVNVATLLLTRGIARQREMSIRAAVGASRPRLIRQMLTESLVIAAAGAVVGGGLAYAGVAVLVPLLPHAGTNQTLATFGPITPHVDMRVLAFTIAVTLMTGVVFGLLPAFQTTRVDFLKTSSSSSTASRAGRAFVVAELTMSIVLLVAALLLIDSFWHLQSLQPGFRADHLVTMPVWLPKTQYERSRTIRFYDDVLGRVRRLPGVQSAGGVSYRPFLGMAMSTRIDIEGPGAASATDAIFVGYDVVTPGYLSVIEQPLLRGRDLSETDDDNAEGAVVINETMARRFWPGSDPLGRRIRPAFSRTDVPWAMDSTTRWLKIVGVAADIREFRLNEQPRPLIYITDRQFPSSFMYLMIRTSVAPDSLFTSLRREINAVDPNQPIATLQTMENAVANAVPRFDVELVGVFAAIALCLSMIGVYGVTSHGVTQRTREIGIRMALGAAARDMVAMVIKETLLVGLAGTGLGVVGALAVTRAMRNMLYGVSPADVAALVGAAVVLLVAALVASYVPARRAARIHPTLALKWD